MISYYVLHNVVCFLLMLHPGAIGQCYFALETLLPVSFKKKKSGVLFVNATPGAIFLWHVCCVTIGQCYFQWCIIFALETFFPGREKLKTIIFLVLNWKCDAMEPWIYLKHFLFFWWIWCHIFNFFQSPY